MSQKILTKKIAEQFLKDEDSVDIWEFASIEDAAAQALAEHKGDLNLSRLTSLSDAAVQALAQYKGNLCLDCEVEELVEQAREMM